MGAGLSRGAARAWLASPISSPMGAYAVLVLGSTFGVGSWMTQHTEESVAHGEKRKQLDDRSIANDLQIIANGKQIAALVAQGQSNYDIQKNMLTAIENIATEVSICKTGQSTISSNLVSCRHPSPRRMASATTPAHSAPVALTKTVVCAYTQEALTKSIKEGNDALGKSIKADNQMTQETIQKGVDDLKDVVGLLRELATTPPVLPPRP